MIDRAHELPVVRQAALLQVSRSSIYALPRPVPPARLAIMHRIDVLHLEHPFAGLADEYGGDPTRYTGPEPFQANITTDPTGAKWAAWLGYDQPGIGVIGAYEGGYTPTP